MDNKQNQGMAEKMPDSSFFRLFLLKKKCYFNSWVLSTVAGQIIRDFFHFYIFSNYSKTSERNTVKFLVC